MSNFWIRTLSGVLFVGAILTAVLWHFYLFVFLFLLFNIASSYEFNKLLLKKGNIWLNVASSGMMFLILALSMFDVISSDWIMLLFIPYAVAFTLDIKRRKFNFTYSLTWLYTLIYPGLGFSFLLLLLFHPIKDFHYSNVLLLALLIVVWVNDTFAYLTGRILGKTPLFPEISPKKTIEGSIGGILFALLSGFLMSRIWAILNVWEWLGFAFLGAVAAIAGDYVESLQKRKAGIKDSGKFLPGHGGALDRFDSLLIAAPVVWIYVLFLYLV